MNMLLVFLLFSIGYANEQNVNGIECEGCKFLVQSMENWIESGKTISEIEARLDKLCNLFPKYNDTCTKFVNAGIEEVIKLVMEFETADKVCAQIGMCKNYVREGLIECEICVQMMTYAKSLVTENKSIDYIKGVMDSYCLLIPMHYDYCKKKVNENIDKIIDMIKQKVSPADICKFIGLCDELNANPVICEGCHYVIAAIEEWLKSRDLEDVIEKKLDAYCKLFPRYVDTCDLVVKVGIPKFIDFIVEVEDPSRICKQIKVC